MQKHINKLSIDKIMYEFLYKGYSLFGTSTYSYQISEIRDREYLLFTNDLVPESCLFEIEEINPFEKVLFPKSHLHSIMNHDDAQDRYFKYLLCQ